MGKMLSGNPEQSSLAQVCSSSQALGFKWEILVM